VERSGGWVRAAAIAPESVWHRQSDAEHDDRHHRGRPEDCREERVTFPSHVHEPRREAWRAICYITAAFVPSLTTPARASSCLRGFPRVAPRTASAIAWSLALGLTVGITLARSVIPIIWTHQFNADEAIFA